MKITKKTSIAEVIINHPETFEVFQKHGLHCIGCPMSQVESIEEGAKAHGIDTDKLIKDLNKSVKKK